MSLPCYQNSWLGISEFTNDFYVICLQTAAQDRKVAAELAAGLAKLVARGLGNSERAAALARGILSTKTNLHAIALGVPQINLGMLHFRNHLVSNYLLIIKIRLKNI